MNKKYVVRLSGKERRNLEAIVKKGKAPAYKIKHANILLNADADGPNLADEEIARLLRCHGNTVRNVRERLVERGFETALQRKKREHPPVERIIDGKKEAQLIALACSKSPEGRSRWTMKLLAEKLVELTVVEQISPSTVCRTLKKMN